MIKGLTQSRKDAKKIKKTIRARIIFCVKTRHSCEGRNPEKSVPNRLDARLRGHDEKNSLLLS